MYIFATTFIYIYFGLPSQPERAAAATRQPSHHMRRPPDRRSTAASINYNCKVIKPKTIVVVHIIYCNLNKYFYFFRYTGDNGSAEAGPLLRVGCQLRVIRHTGIPKRCVTRCVLFSEFHDHTRNPSARPPVYGVAVCNFAIRSKPADIRGLRRAIAIVHALSFAFPEVADHTRNLTARPPVYRGARCIVR